MANYGTVDEVRVLLPPGQRINDQTGYPTGPTSLTVLTRTSNEVNVAFASVGVSLPITDTDLLGDISQKVTREVVYQIVSMRGGIVDKDTVTRIDLWHKEFLAFLAEIKAGNYGSTATASGGSAWSYTQPSQAGVVSEDPSIDPKIDMGARY